MILAVNCSSTVEAISRYPTMNGISLTTSAGIAEHEPSLRHRVSAHATPQDTTATDHQYPTGITCSILTFGHPDVRTRRHYPRHPNVHIAGGTPAAAASC